MSISRSTPLESAHIEQGARFVEFGGWKMPVFYTSILEEHHAVRKAAGLFDISHMGEFFAQGNHAIGWLNKMLTNDVAKLKIGMGQYTFLLNEKGGVIDDLILYRLEEERFLLVVNAAKLEEDFQWLLTHKPDDVVLQNESEGWAAMALQGPHAEQIASEAFEVRLEELPKHNRIAPLPWHGTELWLARTGYTAEDGFEIFVPTAQGIELWNFLLGKGRGYGCVPVGLGARDTLRLEACLPLNGNDLSAEISPLEAGLEKFVCLTKPSSFYGQAAIESVLKNGGPRRISVAFALIESGPPPRAHYPIFCDDEQIGEVTSGGVSPTLQKGIGMALIRKEYAAAGTALTMDVRGRRVLIKVEPKPLYKRSKATS